MHLTHYISDLLFRYECVIIPGFGAFLTHQNPAYINRIDHTFHPPSKRVSFNRQLQTNDGLLANYVASAEKIPYEAALNKIRNFSYSLNNTLKKEKKIDFGSIGSFLYNQEGNVEFLPNEHKNFASESFGLSTFTLSEIQRSEAVKPVFDLTSTEKTSLSTNAKPKTAAYLKYAAVAATTLLLAGFGGMKWYEAEIDNQNIAAREEAQSRVENSIQEATFIISNPLPSMALYIEKKQGDFHVVAGAFKEEANAEKKANELREKGYFPTLMKSQYGLHQVIYDSFLTREEALRNLREIRQNDNPEAWLFIQKIY